MDLRASIRAVQSEEPWIRSQPSAVRDGTRDARRVSLRQELSQRRRADFGPGSAARFEHRRAAGHRPSELLDDPALADPGRTDEHRKRRAAGRRTLEGRPEVPELVLPSYQTELSFASLGQDLQAPRRHRAESLQL